jgi:Icc protein
MIKIAQLTDIHIPEHGVKPFDKDAHQHFKMTLEKIRESEPDLLVVTGDLCYRYGIRDVYTWIKDQLDASDLSYRVIGGNHDDSAMMARVFGSELNDKTGESYYFEHFKGLDLYYLDSARGFFSQAQWDWLADNLKGKKGYPIIFMHHPPFKCGVRHMDDNYAFQQPDKIIELFRAQDSIFQLFCGHYHVERTIYSPPFNVHITPSTLFALDPDSISAKFVHYTPGFRTIQYIPENQEIRHFTTYLSKDF